MRLGLASDGFNPFGNMSTLYSIWLVVLMPYNLPPLRCMKDPYMILVDDLKELWNERIKTYDASTQHSFKLHAPLLWTINDFPAYANLSGWSTKGKLACPIRNENT